MAALVTAIGYFFLALICIIVLACLAFGVHYICWFHTRRCKQCDHRMEFKGLREDKDEQYFFFHCSKCGLWEKIPKEVFLRSMDSASPL